MSGLMTDLSWLTARPIAHRGLHDLNKTCWENTLSAFERAAARGFAIECDVHLTANGDVAVFHDDVLNRLTGTDGFIWQRTTRELAALRVGGTADHVPTLAEMLKLVDGRVPWSSSSRAFPGMTASSSNAWRRPCATTRARPRSCPSIIG